MPELTLPDGGRLHHAVTGTGPALLFVHAGVADSRMWHPQIAALSADFSCITVDLRGWGRSPLPATGFAWRADLAALLRHLDLGAAIVVGASFGGGIALELAIEHPDLVAGLVLIAPNVPGWDLEDDDLEDFQETEEELLADGLIEEAVELNLEAWVDGPKREPGSVRSEIRDLVSLMQAAAFAVEEPEGVDVDRMEPPAGERLDEVSVPTRVIIGDQDHDAIIAVSERVGAAIEGSVHVEVPDVAHMVSLEYPDVVSMMVRSIPLG